MDVARARSKFKERIVDILHFCESGSPLVFVLASAFLDYLAKLPEGKDNGAEGYKDFVAQWLMQVRPEYSSFRYASGQSDLPIQMYHVLRCGILHSFSLIPDSRARDKGGRDRSVVLIHRREAQEEGLGHLGRFASESVRDAAVFVAEDFVDDIAKVIDILFDKAVSDATLRANIERWLHAHPLISGEA